MSTPNLSGNFAVSLWFKANNLGSVNEIITCPNNITGGLGISLDGGNTLTINSPNVFAQNLCSYAFQTGTWYHIIVSRNNGEFSAWINGTNQNVSYQSTYNFSGPIALGWGGGNYGYGFDGIIDEVGIWTKFLTSQNVATLYNAGIGIQYPFITSTLLNGIQAYWKLDNNGSGSVSLIDSTNNGNSLINPNGAVLSSGIINGGAGFGNGTQNNLITTSGDRFPSESTWGSISCWFNAADINSGVIFGDYFRNTLFLGLDSNVLNAGLGNYGGGPTQVSTSVLTNTWYHVVVTYNGTTFSLYLNNNLIDTVQVDWSGQTWQSEGFSLGSTGDNYGGSYQFNGTIDEVGIWNRVLTPTEVTSLYNNGLALSYPFIHTSGLSLWLDASDSSTTLNFNGGPYTANSNTSLLMHFDGSDGSTTFTDSSNNNFSLSAGGTPTISTTQSEFGGSSLYLNGSSFLQLIDDAAFNLSNNPFTIEAWFYALSLPSDIQVSSSVLISKDTYGQNFSWNISLATNGFVFVTSGAGVVKIFPTDNITLNTWHHVSYVYDGTNLSIYLDGALASAPQAVTVTDAGSNISIGCYSWNNPNSFFNGYIDELRVVKGLALPPLRSATNGQAISQWSDKSGNDNHAVQSNSSLRPVLSANTINGKSTIKFDGVSQYLTDTVVGVDGSHTVFLVANRRGTASGNGYEVPLSYGGILVDDGFPFAFDRSNGTFASYPMYYKLGQSGYIDGVSSYSNDTTYIASLPINTQTLTWPFVVNGRSLGTATATSYTSNGNNNIIIGAQPNVVGRYFNGDVAEVLIYNRVLTNIERYDVETYLNEKYNAYTVPSITQDGLVLWLDAGDSRSYPGTGSTWYDLSPSNNNGTLNGGVTYNGNNGGAINLDGFNGYVDFGSYTPANESFTLETVFTWNDYDTDNIGFLFSGNSENLELHTGGGSGTNGIRFIPAGNGGNPYLLDETNIIDANVNHMTVVWNAASNIASIYKNGAFVTSSTLNGASIETLQDLSIGKRANDSYYFSGNIYITRLYDRVLNSTEITNNFNASSARFGL